MCIRDRHTGEHGYREIFPPFMVNSGSMTGTGQLPKFAEDAFKIEGTDSVSYTHLDVYKRQALYRRLFFSS